MTTTTPDLREELLAIADGPFAIGSVVRLAIRDAAAEIARLYALVEEMEGGLGEAFGTLTYIFECGEDEHTGTAAREALDKIDLILTRIKGESMEAVWPYPQTRSKP